MLATLARSPTGRGCEQSQFGGWAAPCHPVSTVCPTTERTLDCARARAPDTAHHLSRSPTEAPTLWNGTRRAHGACTERLRPLQTQVADRTSSAEKFDLRDRKQSTGLHADEGSPESRGN